MENMDQELRDQMMSQRLIFRTSFHCSKQTRLTTLKQEATFRTTIILCLVPLVEVPQLKWWATTLAPTALGINLNQRKRSCGQFALSVSTAAPSCAARLDGGAMVRTAANWTVDERERCVGWGERHK